MRLFGKSTSSDCESGNRLKNRTNPRGAGHRITVFMGNRQQHSHSHRWASGRSGEGHVRLYFAASCFRARVCIDPLELRCRPPSPLVSRLQPDCTAGVPWADPGYAARIRWVPLVSALEQRGPCLVAPRASASSFCFLCQGGSWFSAWRGRAVGWSSVYGPVAYIRCGNLIPLGREN